MIRRRDEGEFEERKKQRILVVDDDWAILALLKFKLNQAGFDVLTARSEKEFWTLAFRENPDLVILDIWLRNRVGTHSYDELLRFGFNPDTPVIFITALLDTPRRKYAAQGGRYALFSKPFEFDELLAEIRRLLSPDRAKLPAGEETLPFPDDFEPLKRNF